MTSITRLFMAVLVLAGTAVLTGCDQQDDAATTGAAPSTESTQTGSTETAPEEPATGVTTTTP
jgi:hypothetical protein